MLVGVHFGDDDLVLGALEAGSQLFIDGRQGLAVATPWREELDQCGLARLQNLLVEVLGRQVEH